MTVRLRNTDFLTTPIEAVNKEFRRQLPGRFTFAEPCCGLEKKLVGHVESLTGGSCVYAGDIQTGANALDCTDFNGADLVITNPPFNTDVLYDILDHLMRLLPGWYLLPSDFAYRRASGFFMKYCRYVVAIGQIKWFEGTDSKGHYNFAWYYLHNHRCKTEFIHLDPPKCVAKVPRQRIDDYYRRTSK